MSFTACWYKITVTVLIVAFYLVSISHTSKKKMDQPLSLLKKRYSTEENLLGPQWEKAVQQSLLATTLT